MLLRIRTHNKFLYTMFNKMYMDILHKDKNKVIKKYITNTLGIVHKILGLDNNISSMVDQIHPMVDQIHLKRAQAKMIRS